MTFTLHPASFRDKSGFIFRSGDDIYRQVNRSYSDNYKKLMHGGLYKDLTESGLLLRHEEVAISPDKQNDDAFCWLKPEFIQFISYPYEWCFSQLKDAALLTLEIQRRAIARGMTLKDASAFNVQYLEGRPVLIDTLSFETYQPGTPWVAYRQFCEHFLAPLALADKCHSSLNRLLALHIDGIPLDIACRLLSRTTWLDPNLAIHLHLHARFQKKFRDKSVEEYNTANKGASVKIDNIVESLKITVNSLSLPKKASLWSDYYAESTYSDESMKQKELCVQKLLASIGPKTVVDFGANTGRFSRIASALSNSVVALDLDPLCIDLLYRHCKDEKQANILPLVVDLCNPTPAIGWHHEERSKLVDRIKADAGLALALMHHLHVTGHVPLDRIARFFADVVDHLIIEFVPLEDPQTRRLLQSRQSNFPDYTRQSFERAFGDYFSIIEILDVQNSDRMLYHMQKKSA